MWERCGTEFTEQKYLTHHIRRFNDEVKCQNCKKKFKNEILLRKHSKIHETCSKEFGLSNSLKKHMRIHTEPKEKCTKCGKLFRTKSNLNKHVKIC